VEGHKFSVRLSSSAPAQEAPPPSHMLLYLNERTFAKGDDGDETARLETAKFVQHAMKNNITMVLVQELDPAQGACPFRQFLEVTPPELQAGPNKLYDTLAVPLYPNKEHREVSMRYIARAMGGAPAVRRTLLARLLRQVALCFNLKGVERKARAQHISSVLEDGCLAEHTPASVGNSAGKSTLLAQSSTSHGAHLPSLTTKPREPQILSLSA